MSRDLSPRTQYQYFDSSARFLKWVADYGYRVIGFRNPKAGDVFIKWEAHPGYPLVRYLKTQPGDHMWEPGDPLAIVEKIS